MKYLVETDFDQAYKELSNITDGKLDSSNFNITDIVGKSLNTAGYFEHLNHCIDIHGRRRKRDGATHMHHIYPLSIGGADVSENTIDLTFYEHLKAHKILADNNPDNFEMQQAYLRLLLSSKDGATVKERVRIAKRVSRLLSIKHGGANNPNYQNYMTDEQKQRLSDIMSEKGNHTPIEILWATEYEPNEAGDNIKAALIDLDTPAGRSKIADLLGYTHPSKITDFCNGQREIPERLLNMGIVGIRYAAFPTKTFNEKRNVIGLDKNTLEMVISPQSLSDAARELSKKLTGDEKNFKQYKGGIQKSCIRNTDPGKLSYKTGYGYYWFYEDEYKPQVKSAIARTMLNANK